MLKFHFLMILHHEEIHISLTRQLTDMWNASWHRKELPDSHKFVHYHWIRVYINHARAEIVRVGIRYSLFQKQEKNHLHLQWGKTWYKIDKILLNIV